MTATQVKAPYVGEILYQCLGEGFDFSRTHAVVVSGAIWNPCGHMLLNTGGIEGWYFHVAEKVGNPRFMRESGYRRYLDEHGKRELSRKFVAIPRPADSQEKLDRLLAKQWWWFVVPNNCASFVEDIVRAGGSSAGLYFNCPSREAFK